MNSLSWLIYLGQVLDTFGIMFNILGIFALVITAIGMIMATVFTSYEDDKITFAKANKRGRFAIKVFAPIAIILLVLSGFMPSKNTVYAIAASELGERIVQSGEVKELTNDAYAALRVWLKKQINEEKK